VGKRAPKTCVSGQPFLARTDHKESCDYGCDFGRVSGQEAFLGTNPVDEPITSGLPRYSIKTSKGELRHT
jgi:hypothetical protein